MESDLQETLLRKDTFTQKPHILLCNEAGKILYGT